MPFFRWFFIHFERLVDFENFFNLPLFEYRAETIYDPSIICMDDTNHNLIKLIDISFLRERIKQSHSPSINEPFPIPPSKDYPTRVSPKLISVLSFSRLSHHHAVTQRNHVNAFDILCPFDKRRVFFF